jgi:hypothetical protein
VAVHLADEQGLDATTAGALPDEARADDARSVDDDQVPGAEQVGQVAKGVVLDGPALRAQTQQTGGVALGTGLLGDAFASEVEVEVGELQKSPRCVPVAPGGTRPRCS